MPPRKRQTEEIDIPTDENNDGEDMVSIQDPDFLRFSNDLRQPHLIQQQELNDLISDLNLSIRQTELLGSLCKNGIYSYRIQKYLYNENHIKK